MWNLLMRRACSGLGAATLLLITTTQLSAHQAVDPALLKQIVPRKVGRPVSSPADLVRRGRQLFIAETFGGNGRTCASCHPPDNNFTLDPARIARLPPNDPLFVAEFNPQLRNLENPVMLRQHALITENLDGFDQPGVLRSVPHLLALRTSITPDPATNGALVDATGWSGDGSPDNGSLLNFAVGAVVQHFTKSLNRLVGSDFRLPTGDELDALVAFQLSLGRQADLENPETLEFHDAKADAGKASFFGLPGFELVARDGTTRTCVFCHAKAGSNNSAGLNSSRQTNAGRLPNAPACLDPSAPGDGGFGVTPVSAVSRATMCGSGTGDIVFRGNELFNSPPLVEAADTPPFFHNNSAATIEDAVAFYASDTFNASPAAPGRAFILDQSKIDQIGAFLRAINAVENIQESLDYIGQTFAQPRRRADTTIRQAIAETTDAIEVLKEAPVPIFTATRPIRALDQARRKLTTAARTGNPNLLRGAQADLERARTLIVN